MENKFAIGGMRNPRESLRKIPGSKSAGKVVHTLLWDASTDPSVASLVDNMLAGKKARPIKPKLIRLLRSLIIKVVVKDLNLPTGAAIASTPLDPEMFACWGALSGDPDSHTLATWLLGGAPLGFTEPVPNTGIFPPVQSTAWELESAHQLQRSLNDWSNHPSAQELSKDLISLIDEAHKKGFCTYYGSVEQAEAAIGQKVVLNKLGVIVKEKVTSQGITRKARIIWDLRESKVNQLCSQGERVLLPKLADAIEDAIRIYRNNGRPSFLAIDIRDAFHNVPAGRDRAFHMRSL